MATIATGILFHPLSNIFAVRSYLQFQELLELIIGYTRVRYLSSGVLCDAIHPAKAKSDGKLDVLMKF